MADQRDWRLPDRRNISQISGRVHGVAPAGAIEAIKISSREELPMLKFIQLSTAASVLAAAAWCVVIAAPGERAAAQSGPLYINAVDLDIVPAEIENFKKALMENGAASVKEPGCREFNIHILASNPNHVFIYEIYDNEAALQSHRQTDHFKKYSTTTASMVAKREARPMTSVAVNYKAH
jgi:quinol monooxygenase YgiN